MALSQFVSVSVVASVSAPTQPSFNIIGIAAYTTAFTGALTRTYQSLTALQADFPTGPIAKAGAALYAQNPNSGVLKVLRLTSPSTKTMTITVATGVNGYTYTAQVNALTASYPSATTTVATIATGLAAAITALGISGVSAAAVGAVITITGTSGTWYQTDISANPLGYLKIAETTADPGMSAMLAAINAQDNNWYGLITADHGTTHNLAVSSWVEANNKVYMPSCQDDGVQDAVSTTDLAYMAKANGLNRTAVWYHQDPGQFLEAGIMGRMFTATPGSANYFLKQISGVTVSTLTDSQVTAITTKNGNVFKQEGGFNVIYYGTMASGRFIDIQTGIDYLTARIQIRIFAAMVNAANKIPYTPLGAGVIEGCIRQQLQEEVSIGFAADDANLTVTIPDVLSQAAIDRAARIMRNCNFTFRAAGAIQTVFVSGTVTA